MHFTKSASYRFIAIEPVVQTLLTRAALVAMAVAEGEEAHDALGDGGAVLVRVPVQTTLLVVEVARISVAFRLHEEKTSFKPSRNQNQTFLKL